jgi:hypothetical protein
MVKVMLTERQSELFGLSEALFEASLALSFGDNELISDDDENSSEDDISNILELTAFEWTRIAILMSDGTRGPYNQFPKSRDFFLTSLQAPDRYFRKMFRYAMLQTYLSLASS